MHDLVNWNVPVRTKFRHATNLTHNNQAAAGGIRGAFSSWVRDRRRFQLSTPIQTVRGSSYSLQHRQPNVAVVYFNTDSQRFQLSTPIQIEKGLSCPVLYSCLLPKRIYIPTLVSAFFSCFSYTDSQSFQLSTSIQIAKDSSCPLQYRQVNVPVAHSSTES